MKHIISHLVLITSLVLLFTCCKKDETEQYEPTIAEQISGTYLLDAIGVVTIYDLDGVSALSSTNINDNNKTQTINTFGTNNVEFIGYYTSTGTISGSEIYLSNESYTQYVDGIKMNITVSHEKISYTGGTMLKWNSNCYGTALINGSNYPIRGTWTNVARKK